MAPQPKPAPQHLNDGFDAGMITWRATHRFGFHESYLRKMLDISLFVLCTVCPVDCSLHDYTSSTAQGGGGSFKNRKPIGEIGCCESRWQSEATDGAKSD